MSVARSFSLLIVLQQVKDQNEDIDRNKRRNKFYLTYMSIYSFEKKMKITDVETIVFKLATGRQRAGSERGVEIALTRISTDQGVDGYCFGGNKDETNRWVKPLVVRENPLDREKLWQRMYSFRVLDERLIAAIDMALWDFAGRLTNLPVYKLLGGCRDKVKAYASTKFNLGPPEVYAEHAEECRKRGYAAYKIHGYRYYDPVRERPSSTLAFPKEDVKVCRAVREQVGEDMILMLDAYGAYIFEQALHVGRELEKLGFCWLESPMPEARIEPYVRLCRELEIAVCAPETPTGNLYTRAEWFLRGACDISKTDVLQAGLTSCKKTADLCEAFGTKCEIHNAGIFGNFGNLQVLGSTSPSTCEFYEKGLLDRRIGREKPHPFLKAVCDHVDAEGYVRLPQKPGLGMEINWDYIEEHRADKQVGK